MEIWSNRSSCGLAQVTRWPCCVLHLCLCSCFCVVIGAIGMVSAKWNFPTGDSIGCTEYHCLCKHALHFHCGPAIPYHALSLEVWLVHLLCLFLGTHDPLCLFLLAGDQEHSYWRNDTCHLCGRSIGFGGDSCLKIVPKLKPCASIYFLLVYYLQIAREFHIVYWYWYYKDQIWVPSPDDGWT